MVVWQNEQLGSLPPLFSVSNFSIRELSGCLIKHIITGICNMKAENRRKNAAPKATY